MLSTKVFMILPLMILRNLNEQNHGGQNHEAEDSIPLMTQLRRLIGQRHRIARLVVSEVARMTNLAQQL